MNKQQKTAARAARNRRSTLPVSRNIIGARTSTVGQNVAMRPETAHANLATGVRKGKRPSGSKGGNSMWRTVSQNYRTMATIDRRWDHRNSDFVKGFPA